LRAKNFSGNALSIDVWHLRHLSLYFGRKMLKK
jgi:hypothetical protein